MKSYPSITKQTGAATLLTAIVLLISITLIAFLTAKTVLVETQINADNYRISQATAAANAAMDRGVAYFMQDGFDHNHPNNGIDYTINAPFQFTMVYGGQTTRAQFYFDNTNDAGDTTDDLCPAAVPNNKRGIIVATGWSDDGVAVRTVSQCVGTIDIFKGGAGPEQAFVSKAGVGVNGTGTIINRYTNTNVWAGGNYGGPSAAYNTYIRKAGLDIADIPANKIDSATIDTNYDQKVSDRNSGIGLDVITDDKYLSSKTTSTLAEDMNSVAKNEFFDMYFSNTKQGILEMAKNTKNGQYYTNGTVPVGTTGLVWVEGNYKLESLGDSEKDVILIVNGDLDISGNINFYGTIYVTGKITGTGTPTIYGSIIGENSTAAHSMSATSTIVFKPWGGSGEDQTQYDPGTGTIVAGTWKDW